MASSSASTAVQDALAIPELLTDILSLVDMKTLLVSCQRVNKCWAETIKTSQEIQQKLFFQPAPPDPSVAVPKPNPLLRKHFGEVFGLAHDSTLRCTNCFFMLPWAPARKRDLEDFPEEVDDFETTPLHEAFTRAGASWRRMLVSQPPTQELGVAEYERKIRMWANQTGTVVASPLWPRHGDHNSLVMGQIYDFVLEFFRNNPHQCFFKIVWNQKLKRLVAVFSPMSMYVEGPDDCIRTNVVHKLFQSKDCPKFDLPEPVKGFLVGEILGEYDYYFDGRRDRDIDGIPWKCQHYACARETDPDSEGMKLATDGTGLCLRKGYSMYSRNDMIIRW